MRIFTPIFLCGFIALANSLMAAEPFLESGGRVIMEVESAPVAGSWTKETYAADYTGTAFYEWKKGDPAMGTVAAGQGILSYPVKIATTGRYRLQIRSNPAASTEHNDVWVRVLGASKVEAVRDTDIRNLGENWTKSYNNSANKWTWNTNTVDHDAHAFYVEATAGSTITVELSGRSTQFKVDRIVLYTSAHTTAAATSTALVESPRGSGGGGGTNLPPTVSAGADQPVTMSAGVSLTGTATDDGLPSPATLTTTWTKLSGPGTVTFANASAKATTATFSLVGTYVLRLTASDGALSTSDNMTVTVSADSSGTTAPPKPGAPNKSGDGTATPTVGGTTSPGATVHIFVDGTEVGTTTAGSDGTWTYTLTGLSAGSHAITVTAQNVGGTSPPSTATNVNVAGGGSSTPPASDGGGGGSGCGLGSLSASLMMALFAFMKFAHSLRAPTRLDTHGEKEK